MEKIKVVTINIEKDMYFGVSEIYDVEQISSSVRDIKKRSADILVTIDLEGFEQVTLTENVSFNLLDCKQIHILAHENLSNESMLMKPLSLSMFFYVDGDDYYDYLKNKYPGLPYLKKIDGWQPGESEADRITNSQIISNIIDEVVDMCGL